MCVCVCVCVRALARADNHTVIEEQPAGSIEPNLSVGWSARRNAGQAGFYPGSTDGYTGRYFFD